MKKVAIIILVLCSFISLYALSILNTDKTTLFSGSGNCQSCHQSDGNIMNYEGKDISPVALWRSTMMAHSAKDPLWRAVVSEESHSNPDFSDIIESTCTRCHAPMGNRQAREDGEESYLLSDLYVSKLALDGVSCAACHQIQNSEFESASSYSGMYQIDNSRKIYGPYQNPLAMPMQNFVNYTPEYRKAIAHSELCATCHTLFAPYFDNNNQIGGTFPEQTPYIEWKISEYPEMGKSCQECHMPAINEGIDIATTPNWDNTLRSPFWKHDFVGGNSYMLGVLKNMEASGSEMSANSAQFEQTIAQTNSNLNNAADLILSLRNGFLVAEIINLTGHKLPTGIPFRRMWLQVSIKNQDGQAFFESGTPTEKGRILSNSAETQIHRDTIFSEEEIQIWEATPADVNGNSTFALLRASNFIKDNRIPPKGFDRLSPSYDTCAIYGRALEDNNFGDDGKDIVYYKLPDLTGGTYTATVSLLYQSVKPGLVDYLKTVNTNEISTFVKLYDENPNIPAVIESKNFDFTISGVEDKAEHTKILYFDNHLLIEAEKGGFANISVSDLNGKSVFQSKRYMHKGKNQLSLEGLHKNSVYFVKLEMAGKNFDYKFIK